MLTLETRPEYQTLLDATWWQAGGSTQPAVIYVATDKEPVVVTQAELKTKVQRCAALLATQQIGTGDVVLLAQESVLDTVVLFWGAIFRGAIPTIFPTLSEKIDPELTVQRMKTIVSFSDIATIVADGQIVPRLRGKVPCPILETNALLNNEERLARKFMVTHSNATNSDEIALLQHSSGTTGLQKGVALSHRALLNQLASYSSVLQLAEDDVVVSWLPLYHDMGLIAGFLLPLMQGIPLVLMSPFDWVRHPALLFRAIDQYRGTLCWLPNFAYNHCARRIRKRDLQGLSLSHMRAFINCSEPVRADSHRQFAEKFAPLGVTPEMLSVCYAMAENTFAVTQTDLGDAPAIDAVDQQQLIAKQQAHPASKRVESMTTEVVSCGRPLPGCQVQVVRHGHVVPDRDVGEIAIRSDSMLTEYYRRPELQPLDQGWYLTGDMGYLADGQLYVIGRAKDIIINAGKNIYPQDIEAIVNGIDGVYVGRVVVFGIPDRKEGTELLAVVAETEIGIDDRDARIAVSREIRARVARQSSVTVTYVELVARHWLIKTSSGKVARSANREKWLAERLAAGKAV